MFSKEQINKNTSCILRYLRKVNNLTQKDMAERLECSRSNYSRIEGCTKELNITQMLLVEREFEIGELDFKFGIITKSKISNQETFKLPYQYSKNNYTGGKVVNIYKYLTNYASGEGQFDKLCKKLGIDPLYFVDIRNGTTIEFSMSIIQALVREGLIKSHKEIENLAFMTFSPINMKSIDSNFESTNPVARIRRFIETADSFEKNHTYKIEDLNERSNEITISFKPKSHVDLNLYKYDLLVSDFFGHWIQNSIKALSFSSPVVKEKANFHKGDDSYIFTYRFENSLINSGVH